MNNSVGQIKLFYSQELSNYLEAQKSKILYDISTQKDEYFAQVKIEEYLQYLEQQFSLETPILLEDQIQVEEPKQKSVISYGYFSSREGGESAKVDGISVKVVIPVEGNINLFGYKPNQHFLSFINANISKNSIVLEYHIPMSESNNFDLKIYLDKDLNQIKQWLGFMDNDIQMFNKNIKSYAQPCIDRKIYNYKSINTLVSTIPYPIKRSTDQPVTFEVPQVRRKPQISKPVMDKKNNNPEPTLAIGEYEHIMKICSDMSVVMERSPHIFEKIYEEDLRIHFLIQLNGHYEGQATGETFNLGGKTDILIRDENQNIFIGECKYWHGEKGYLETIDQLLGYVTCRDTKTSILLFVRNQDFSNVLTTIEKVTPNHSNFVSEDNSYKPPVDSALRYTFKNKNDENKHFLLTVMAFHIPSKS